jgi:hypothetical protein
MTRPAPHPRPRIAAAAVCVALLAPAATCVAAQDEVEPPPPPNRALTLQTPVVGYGIMAIATAGVIVVSLMRSKRGAQD